MQANKSFIRHLIAILGFVSAFSSTAFAEETVSEAPESDMQLRFSLGIDIQPGFDIEGDYSFRTKPWEMDNRDSEREYSAGVTFGLDAKVILVFGSNFSLGVDLRYTSMSNISDSDSYSYIDEYRSYDLFDISLTPRLMYPVSFGSGQLEPFVGVSVGLTLANGDDTNWTDTMVVGLAPGLHFGAELGTNWFFLDNVGVYAGVGWRMHFYESELIRDEDGHWASFNEDFSHHEIHIGAGFIVSLGI